MINASHRVTGYLLRSPFGLCLCESCHARRISDNNSREGFVIVTCALKVDSHHERDCVCDYYRTRHLPLHSILGIVKCRSLQRVQRELSHLRSESIKKRNLLENATIPPSPTRFFHNWKRKRKDEFLLSLLRAELKRLNRLLYCYNFRKNRSDLYQKITFIFDTLRREQINGKASNQKGYLLSIYRDLRYDEISRFTSEGRERLLFTGNLRVYFASFWYRDFSSVCTHSAYANLMEIWPIQLRASRLDKTGAIKIPLDRLSKYFRDGEID